MKDMKKAVKDFLKVEKKVNAIGNKSGLRDDALMDLILELRAQYMAELGYSEDDIVEIEEHLGE